MRKKDYREKTVKGVILDMNHPQLKACDITVRMTSDSIGQSLSLQGRNIMIEIPLEQVRDIIRVTYKGET